jgi:hypothetical protein
MILTEKEAVEKYCHRTMTPQALRREEDLFCPARCSVSGCMAWRWMRPDLPLNQRITGYCGLAGKPEAAG